MVSWGVIATALIDLIYMIYQNVSNYLYDHSDELVVGSQTDKRTCKTKDICSSSPSLVDNSKEQVTLTEFNNTSTNPGTNTGTNAGTNVGTNVGDAGDDDIPSLDELDLESIKDLLDEEDEKHQNMSSDHDSIMVSEIE